MTTEESYRYLVLHPSDSQSRQAQRVLQRYLDKTVVWASALCRDALEWRSMIYHV